MKKRLFILVLIFSIGFSVPFHTSHGAGAIAYIAKEFGLDLVARLLARFGLDSLTEGILNTVNNLGSGSSLEGESGTKGPSFVRSWKRLMADAQKVGEDQFRAQLKYADKKGILCANLRPRLSSIFQTTNVPFIDIGQKKYNSELKQNTLLPFQTKIKCTVPNKVITEFTKDFEKGGGWETWVRMIEPQNNFAGALGIAFEELNKQRAKQEEAKKSEALAGQGFQGTTKRCEGLGQDSQCTFFGKTITPPKILQEGASKWIDANMEWLTSSDELSEVLVNILSKAIFKLADLTASKIVSDPEDRVEQSAPDYLPSAEQDRQDFKDIEKNTEETSKNTEGLGETINDLDNRITNLENTPTPTPQ